MTFCSRDTGMAAWLSSFLPVHMRKWLLKQWYHHSLTSNVHAICNDVYCTPFPLLLFSHQFPVPYTQFNSLYHFTYIHLIVPWGYALAYIPPHPSTLTGVAKHLLYSMTPAFIPLSKLNLSSPGTKPPLPKFTPPLSWVGGRGGDVCHAYFLGDLAGTCTIWKHTKYIV